MIATGKWDKEMANRFMESALKAKAEREARGPVTWVVTSAIVDGNPLEHEEEYTAMLRYEAESMFQNAHGGYQAHSFRGVQIVEKALIEQNKETNRRNGYNY